MADTDSFRQRLASAGAAIPDDLVDMVAAMAGDMLVAHQRLTELDLADVEPFSPAVRLVLDAK